MIADAAHDLRPEHLVEIGLPGLEGAQAEADARTGRSRRRSAGARRAGARAATAIGAVSELGDAGHQHDRADLERAVRRARSPGTPASDRPSRRGRCRAAKLSAAAEGEVAVGERDAARRSAARARRRAANEGRRRLAAHSASRPSTQAGGPAALRRFLQRRSPAPRAQRHQDQRQPCRGAARGAIDRRSRGRNQAATAAADDARRDVDQEQPVPGIGLGDPAADDRPDGRRQHRQHAGDAWWRCPAGGRETAGTRRRRPAGSARRRRSPGRTRQAISAAKPPLAAQPTEASVNSARRADEQPAHG